MNERVLFKMTTKNEGVLSHEFYIIIDDKYYFFDPPSRLWCSGYYETWIKKLSIDGDLISETSELEILVLAGEEMIKRIRTFKASEACPSALFL